MSKPRGFDMQEHFGMVDELLSGLNTDGGHHKQWALEMALFKLVGEEEYTRLKEKHQWEEGIVP